MIKQGWHLYNMCTKEMLSAGGGSYSRTGHLYTEKVDFLQQVEADFRVAAYRTCCTRPTEVQHMYRADKCLQLQVNGDTMQVTGVLPNGYVMQETWQRVE